jgi:hypothetical protein
MGFTMNPQCLLQHFLLLCSTIYFQEATFTSDFSLILFRDFYPRAKIPFLKVNGGILKTITEVGIGDGKA